MTSPLDRLAAALKGRYVLERELGQGGMATVYLADDPRHHRKVALKVLRPDLAATLGPERFLREVTIAANLQHPHILPVYDSGETDGFLYYVMPYVEGESLRERLVKHGELPLMDAVRILRDVADAMTAAHAKGVVHRDIKPENIMLSGRHALVADFGVAKAVSEATGRQTLTTAGVALGTPTYMAPEQAAADPHTDHRADLYAFGVTAYEVLTGQPPFTGVTPQAVLAAHMSEAPVTVTQRRTTIPPPLAQLIMRCLEKKPADRPQSAEELLAVLEGLAATPSGGITPAQTQPVPAVAAGRRSRWPLVAAAAVVVLGLGTAAVMLLGGGGKHAPAADVREPVVVLPFEVQSADQTVSGLGVQVAEQLAAAIAQASLGEVATYRPGEESAVFTPEAARRAVAQTGAATLVTGVIAQLGQSVEIQARVVRASDLGTVWTLGPERGAAADPTAPLDAMRDRVLGAVGWYLRPVREGNGNPGIYQPPLSLELFRLADQADQMVRRARSARAIPLLVEGCARDTAWLGGALQLAMAYLYNGRWAEGDSVSAWLQARRERLAPGDALMLDLARSLYSSPEEEHRAATALLRADSSQIYNATWAVYRAGYPEEALRYYALRDTTEAGGRAWQSWDRFAAQAYHMLGRFQEEVDLIRAAREREPHAYGHVQAEVQALAALGRVDEIERLITESYALETPGAPVRLLGAAAAEFAMHGYPDAARDYAERTLAGVAQLPDTLRNTVTAQNLRRYSMRLLGRHREVRAMYEEEARAFPPGGLELRILGMRDAILMGDTVGALALVDSARTEPMSSFPTWAWKGNALYYAAHILALLGRKDEAVATFRAALNNGWRVGPDEALAWYWEPIKDYPPFLELVKVRG